MACSACVSRSLPVAPAADRASARRQRVIGLVLLGAVIALDQGTKAWAWRHQPGTIINPGSTRGLGGFINDWYSGPVSGAVLDLLSLGLLCLAGFGLVRARRSRYVFVPGVLLIAGWASNLLDRLGLHELTAPGSVRGAVDFIRVGDYLYNVADGVIIGATVVLVPTLIVLRDLDRRDVGWGLGPIVPGARRRPFRMFRQVRLSTATFVLAGAVVVSFHVAIRAVHHGGTDRAIAGMDAPTHRDAIVGTSTIPFPRASHGITPVARCLAPAGPARATAGGRVNGHRADRDDLEQEGAELVRCSCGGRVAGSDDLASGDWRPDRGDRTSGDSVLRRVAARRATAPRPHVYHVGWPIDAMEIARRGARCLPVYLPTDPKPLDQRPYWRFAQDAEGPGRSHALAGAADLLSPRVGLDVGRPRIQRRRRPGAMPPCLPAVAFPRRTSEATAAPHPWGAGSPIRESRGSVRSCSNVWWRTDVANGFDVARHPPAG